MPEAVPSLPRKVFVCGCVCVFPLTTRYATGINYHTQVIEETRHKLGFSEQGLGVSFWFTLMELGIVKGPPVYSPIISHQVASENIRKGVELGGEETRFMYKIFLFLHFTNVFYMEVMKE